MFLKIITNKLTTTNYNLRLHFVSKIFNIVYLHIIYALKIIYKYAMCKNLLNKFSTRYKGNDKLYFYIEKTIYIYIYIYVYIYIYISNACILRWGEHL